MGERLHRPLAEFAADVHSQHGEDGILAEVFRRLEPGLGRERWCVEFGAWDGLHLSNTARLILESGWHAVLIEPVRERCEEILRNLPSDRVTAVCSAVGLDAPDRLDDLLAATPAPVDLDLVSIDIDGDDLHVLRTIDRYRAKVVCIEFNPTMPNEVRYVQPVDRRSAHGSSAASTLEVAERMGYVLAAVTETNLVVVRDDVADLVLGSDRPSLAALRDDSTSRCLLFSGYDGTLLTSTPVRLPWHDVTVRSQDLQVLPRVLRRFPGVWSRAQRLAMGGWTLTHDREAFRRWFAVRWSARTAHRRG